MKQSDPKGPKTSQGPGARTAGSIAQYSVPGTPADKDVINMYLCMYACMYVRYIYIYRSVDLHTDVLPKTIIHTCTYVYMFMYKYICTSTYIHIYIVLQKERERESGRETERQSAREREREREFFRNVLQVSYSIG